MKRKLISAAVAAVLTVTSVAPAVAAPTEPISIATRAEARIPIIVDDIEIFCDQPPDIVEDRTLVPLRAIFEALGAQVEYFADTRTVSGYDPQTNRIMSLVLDQKTLFCADYTLFQVYEANPTSQAAINFVLSHTKEIDVPATSIGGRTMVPARVIAESLGASVVWDGNTRVVTITR